MAFRINVDLDGFMDQTSITNVKRGQYALANQAMSDMEQFVPKNQGHLRDSVHATSNGSQITYAMPYAKAQFYGIINGYPVHNYSTPGTTKRWDLKAKSMFMDSWVKAFTEGMK
ncbi:minor capsid protein [Lactiplantibacillus plantarum]|uniref:minor capsid protein n=1 Tax=Lactiplantibacillus plantarum TaxID=1590 RepID=UPI000437BCC8|nr:minor capsid protein [Lactiplantibacillus plantarum]EYR70629.1 capsid protein [Lactiplantibacillus plantarum WHE 92]AMO30115.1 capsid protein [Lactiplantibacillus plantarum]AZU38877.1 capsid protein [Lactiplantibacillus plantarum]MBO3684034.1 minor capsid protein [Lactiplantibacillus plantarum]MCI3955505.1 minor capsid protein [Lactiplantibacillus plantarum]